MLQAGNITNTVNTGQRAGSMSGLVLDVYGCRAIKTKLIGVAVIAYQCPLYFRRATPLENKIYL